MIIFCKAFRCGFRDVSVWFSVLFSASYSHSGYKRVPSRMILITWPQQQVSQLAVVVRGTGHNVAKLQKGSKYVQYLFSMFTCLHFLYMNSHVWYRYEKPYFWYFVIFLDNRYTDISNIYNTSYVHTVIYYMASGKMSWYMLSFLAVNSTVLNILS